MADSRNHFKTADQRDLYNNREQVRDDFLKLWNRVKQTLVQNLDAEFARQSKSVLEKLAPGNLMWFAQLFVKHLLMGDPDVTRLAHGLYIYI